MSAFQRRQSALKLTAVGCCIVVSVLTSHADPAPANSSDWKVLSKKGEPVDSEWFKPNDEHDTPDIKYSHFSLWLGAHVKNSSSLVKLKSSGLGEPIDGNGISYSFNQTSDQASAEKISTEYSLADFAASSWGRRSKADKQGTDNGWNWPVAALDPIEIVQFSQAPDANSSSSLVPASSEIAKVGFSSSGTDVAESDESETQSGVGEDSLANRGLTPVPQLLTPEPNPMFLAAIAGVIFGYPVWRRKFSNQ